MQYEKCVVWINPTYFSRHSPPFEATSNPALTAAFVDAAETPTASAQARNLLQRLLPESPKAAEKKFNSKVMTDKTCFLFTIVKVCKKGWSIPGGRCWQMFLGVFSGADEATIPVCLVECSCSCKSLLLEQGPPSFPLPLRQHRFRT